MHIVWKTLSWITGPAIQKSLPHKISQRKPFQTVQNREILESKVSHYTQYDGCSEWYTIHYCTLWEAVFAGRQGWQNRDNGSSTDSLDTLVTPAIMTINTSSLSHKQHMLLTLFLTLYNYYTHKTRAQLKWSLQNGKIIINMPNHGDKVTAPNKVTKTYKEAQFIQLTPFHHGPTILGLPYIHQRGYTSKARNKTIYT